MGQDMLVLQDCVMLKTANCLPLQVEASLLSQTSSCGICGEKKIPLGLVFVRMLPFSLFLPPVLQTRIYSATTDGSQSTAIDSSAEYTFMCLCSLLYMVLNMSSTGCLISGSW